MRREMIRAGQLKWMARFRGVRPLLSVPQRQRVLADQELDNGGVAVVASSVMKGRAPVAVGDGQQHAPLPRVELGLHDHQQSKFQWRRVDTGVYDGKACVAVAVMVEDLIDRVAG